MFHDILIRKNAFLGHIKNEKLKKLKNWSLSKDVTPWFWWKIGHTFHLYILGKMAQENVFHDIVERKTPF